MSNKLKDKTAASAGQHKKEQVHGASQTSGGNVTYPYRARVQAKSAILPVHQGPRADSKTVSYLRNGDEITVLGIMDHEGNHWLYVFALLQKGVDYGNHR